MYLVEWLSTRELFWIKIMNTFMFDGPQSAGTKLIWLVNWMWRDSSVILGGQQVVFWFHERISGKISAWWKGFKLLEVSLELRSRNVYDQNESTILYSLVLTNGEFLSGIHLEFVSFHKSGRWLTLWSTFLNFSEFLEITEPLFCSWKHGTSNVPLDNLSV